MQPGGSRRGIRAALLFVQPLARRNGRQGQLRPPFSA